MKKIASMLLVLAMLCTMICGITVPVSAASGVKAKLDTFMKSYPSGNSWTSSFDGGVECYGFAKLAVYNVFGSYNSSRYRSWFYDGTSTSGMSVVGSITNYSTTNVKNLLSKAKCGDVLQFNTPKQHSMIVYSVESDGVMIYDCNWVGYCKISLRKVDFGAWSGRNSTKLTLLRSDNYSAIGDDSPFPTPDTCTCSTSYAGTYTCTTSSYPLTIRSGHSTSYSAIGSIPSGATVTVTKANGSWAHVSYNGVSGYASMEYLTVPLQATSAYPVPFKCYPLSSADHAADAYDSINGNHIGYIYGSDYCTVKAVYDNGWCLVNCPWNGGTKDVYTWTAFFLNIKCSPYTEVVQAKANTYIRVGSSSTLGWVDKGDHVTIVDNTSARAQIIYPHSDGSYRCAWVDYNPAFTHNHTPGAAATCTSPQVCTTCDATIVNAKGHSAGAAATCTNPQTCTRCGIVINDAKGHTPGTAATCTTAQKCTVCGVTIANAKGHTPGAAATCTTVQTCTTCGATINPAKGHSYSLSHHEAAHPHRVYTVCACGQIGDYTGETTKVSGCEECYPAPTVSGITYSPSTVKVGDTVTFTLNSTGGTEYCICIGDGNEEIFKSLKSSCAYQFTKAGTYYIYGWTRNAYGTTYPDTVTLVVEDNTVSVSGVSLNKSTAAIDVGNTLNLTATVSPSNATNTAVTWTSSNPSVATVTNGTVTALKAGTTTITATTVDGSKTATCVVTVNETPIVDADVTYTIGSASGKPGSTVEVALSVSSDVDVNGLLLDNLSYDENALEFVEFTEYGDLITTSALGANGVDSATGEIALGYTEAVTPNGEICIIKFRVKDTAEDGEYTINIDCAASANGQKLPSKVNSGKITISKWVSGDFDSDEKLDMKDVVYFMNWINFSWTGKYPMTYEGDKDFNKDGNVDMKDVVYFMNWVNFSWTGKYDINW